MSKEPSKADQLRALREAKFERQKPTIRPPLSTAEVEAVPRVQTRPAQEAADLQAEADKIAAKGRSDGKKSIWISGKQAKLLKIAAAKHEVTQEAIVGEGIAEMLNGRYKP